MTKIGDCSCLDEYHKENIVSVLSDDIGGYRTHILKMTEEARKLRERGNIETAELADHSIKSFKYLQNDLQVTLDAVLAIKNCK